MADATSGNIAAIPPGVQLVAGYVTGTPDVQWSAADWARFPGLARVTIDQGYQSPPITTATVRDVEPVAWSPAAAVNRANWRAARPTIYCDQYDLQRPGGVLAAGWQGDLWLAIPNWQPGHALPATPGCTVVAVQSDYTNPAVDLSYVLDSGWPLDLSRETDDMLIKGSGPGVYMLSGGRLAAVDDQQSLTALQAAGIQLATVSDATLTAWLAAFPPGNPAVNMTFPALTVTPVAA